MSIAERLAALKSDHIPDNAHRISTACPSTWNCLRSRRSPISPTAACLTTDRAIDIGRLERLVKKDDEARQRLLFEVAAELYGREQAVSLSELLAELDGEDLDRVLYAIAVVKRGQVAIPGSPDDLWIRAAEPE